MTVKYTHTSLLDTDRHKTHNRFFLSSTSYALIMSPRRLTTTMDYVSAANGHGLDVHPDQYTVVTAFSTQNIIILRRNFNVTTNIYFSEVYRKTPLKMPFSNQSISIASGITALKRPFILPICACAHASICLPIFTAQA
jgi:hypothetical protein